MRLIRLRSYLPSFISILAISILPVVFSFPLWLDLWNGKRSRAWDGSGHYALSYIYDQTIFPESFGWTHEFFCGMPFPNFYPPLFYWLVALIHHTHIFSFDTAFKLVVALPSLLLPAGLWVLAWRLSGRDSLAAVSAAFACFLLLIDLRFHLKVPVGLDYYSTFISGLYSQPLGFALLIAWYLVYLGRNWTPWRLICASLLLALTILANFFSAVTAAMLVTTSIAADIVAYYRATSPTGKHEMRKAFLSHLAVPLLALGCILFWLIPVLTEYKYFVTRPEITPITDLVPPLMWGWYLLSAVSIFRWIRHPTPGMGPYLGACAILAGSVVFGAVIAPGWFPLQPRRLLTTLNFLLAVPIGLEVSSALRSLAVALGEHVTSDSSSRDRSQLKYRAYFTRAPLTIAITSIALLSTLALIKLPDFANSSFYLPARSGMLDDVLAFGREHRDGRYLVEFADLSYVGVALDSRALSAYLGAQRNQTLSVVFREASGSSVFMNPIVSTFSSSPDNFGISSLLADDVDFFEQPLAQHLRRARLVGVKYLVIFSPFMKQRLSAEPDIAAVFNFGEWSVFQLSGQPVPPVRVLPYRPALVISSLSLKARRRDEYNFVRLVEEQLIDGWHDVTLLHSTQSKIDMIQDLDQFGALVVDVYEADNEDLAFERLKDFARFHPLILLSGEATLFNRIRSSITDFPLAVIVQRSKKPGDVWLTGGMPSSRYESSEIRTVWRTIRRTLDQHKVSTNFSNASSIVAQVDQQRIRISTAGSIGEKVPVLIETTFHPNWQRDDKQQVYPATPFFMLTFIDKPASLSYGRSSYERVGLWLSALVLVIICLSPARHRLYRTLSVFKRTPEGAASEKI